MRTTVAISDPVLENAKRAAAERGVSLGQLFEDALRSFLSPAAAPAPPPFRLHTVRGVLVRHDLDLDRTSQLIVEDDEAAYGRQP